jgi:16S rRNA processing protein RimM
MADRPLPDETSPQDAAQDAYLAVARVVAAHGVRGDVRCAILTDFPERFKRGLGIFVGAKRVPHQIERARLDHKGVVLKLSEVDDRDAAEALRGAELCVAEKDAVRLPRGTYFWHQIIGLRVRTTEGQVLGTVADILETGSADVYVVQPDPPAQGELLLPAIKDVVQNIDLRQGEITVALIEGLG